MKPMPWFAAFTILSVLLAQACRLKAQEQPTVPNRSKTPHFTFSATLALSTAAAQDQENPCLSKDGRPTGRTYDTSDNPFMTTPGKYGDPFPAYFEGVWHLYTLQGGLETVRVISPVATWCTGRNMNRQ